MNFSTYGLHTPEASDLHVCALSPVLSHTNSGLAQTPVIYACVCIVPRLQGNDRAVVLQDVLEGELTFRDGLPGQPSTCYSLFHIYERLHPFNCMSLICIGSLMLAFIFSFIGLLHRKGRPLMLDTWTASIHQGSHCSQRFA